MIFLLSAHPKVDLINVGPLLVLLPKVLAYILGGCAGIIRRMERRWLLVKEREPLSDLEKSISMRGDCLAFEISLRGKGTISPSLAF